MGTGLCILAAVIVGFNLITAALFWYETATGEHRECLRRLSENRPGWWLARSFFSGCVSMTLVAFTYPLGWLHGLWRETHESAGARPLVVLVHGLYHNPSAWIRFRRKLRRRGFDQFTACRYSSWNTEFDQAAAACRRQLTGLLVGRPRARLVLIGHSMGGLVLCELLRDPELAARVDALVTLGTPFQGSRLAALALGRLGRSLIPDGPVPAALHQDRPAPALPKARLALVSPTDNMVLPNAACLPAEPGWTVDYTAPVSHVSLLYHGPTIDRALRFIEQSLNSEKE